MGRYTRNQALQIQVETVYSQTPGAWDGTHTLLLRGPVKHNIRRRLVNRDLLRPYLGGSEQMVATRPADIEFDFELAGSGTPGTLPPYDGVLRACAHARTITAGNRVEYNPTGTNGFSASLRYFADGARYVSRGARGSVMFMLDAFGIPFGRAKMIGFDTAVDEAVLPAADYTAWQRPLVLTAANAGSVLLGCTYSAGSLSGGTSLSSRALQIDQGNPPVYHEILNAEEVDVTQRETTGRMSVELTAAQEVTWRNDINNNVLTTLGFAYGTTPGNRITLFNRNVQRVDPQREDYEGKQLIATELRMLPLAGNDEYTLAVR